MSDARIPLEALDGLNRQRLTEGELAHLRFVERQDALVRRFGERSYLIPDRCPPCAGILTALHALPPGDPR